MRSELDGLWLSHQAPFSPVEGMIFTYFALRWVCDQDNRIEVVVWATMINLHLQVMLIKKTS